MALYNRNSMEINRNGCNFYKAAFVISVCLLCESLARPMHLCGLDKHNLTLFHPDEHICVNGTLIVIKQSPITEPTTTSQCKNSKPAQNCNGEPVCGPYRCCGGQFIYHPGFETCCTFMFKAVVHQAHAEREHVCCGTDVYPRGRQPCLHESQNDRLWDEHPTLGRKAFQDLCSADFVYTIRRIRKTPKGEREAILRQLKPNTKKSIILPLAEDKYTPRRKVIKNSIVLLTKSDRVKERTFFTYTNDHLYKVPKRRGQFKINIIRKRLRNCWGRFY